MTLPVTLPLLQLPVRLSPHQIVVARLSAAHSRGEHTSPVFACYDCLQGRTPASIALKKAA
jgi:hypothetical protein